MQFFVKLLTVLALVGAPSCAMAKSAPPAVVTKAAPQPTEPPPFKLKLPGLGLEAEDEKPIEVECPKLGHCVPEFKLGDIDSDNLKKLREFLGKVKEEPKAEAVLIVIDSTGGSVSDGKQMVDEIEDLKIPSICVVDGEAASMAFYVLQACTTRAMTRWSTLLVHEPYMIMYTPMPKAIRLNDLRNMEEEVRTLITTYLEYACRRLNVPAAYVRERIAGNRNWMMVWEEAKRAGAIDTTTPALVLVREQLRGWGKL